MRNGIERKHLIIEFLDNHNQAYLDFLHHFGAITEKEFNDPDVAFEIKEGIYAPDTSDIAEKDVIDWLEAHKELYNDFLEWVKQFYIKPVWLPFGPCNDYCCSCPNCEEQLFWDFGTTPEEGCKECPKCGQAIDWSNDMSGK